MPPVVLVGSNHTNLPDMLLLLQPIAYLCVSYLRAESTSNILGTKFKEWLFD